MEPPILVPLDGSDLAEQALPYAEALAGSVCQLVLLEVGQDADDEFALPERHRDSCAQLETVVGDPAEQILQVTRQVGAGMIVMTTHGRGAIERWAFGSVADQVTRRSPVPVMVIRPDAGGARTTAPRIRRLVVPLDGSARAEQALPAAESLAKRLRIPVHLVSAIGSPNAAAMELAIAASDATLLELAESISGLFTEAEVLLRGHAERLQGKGIASSWEVLRGSPYFAIADAVQPDDVIVMTSQGRGGVTRWLLGSVAEKLVREGPVPIILVPDDAHPAGPSLAIAADTGASR